MLLKVPLAKLIAAVLRHNEPAHKLRYMTESNPYDDVKSKPTPKLAELGPSRSKHVLKGACEFDARSTPASTQSKSQEAKAKMCIVSAVLG